MSLADQAERRLVMQAVEKARRGEGLTTREQRALRKYETDKEKDDRWRHYTTVPKKDYLKLSGRPDKVVNDQARLYGLPLMGRTLDLAAILSAFHDLLAKFKHRLGADAADGDPMLSGKSTPALEDYRKWRAKLAELDFRAREGELVPREQIHQGHIILAALLREFGETLQREFGPDAHRLWEDLLDDYQREVDRLSGDDSNNQHAPA